MSRTIPSWNEYFMAMLDPISNRSKDPNTQVSCLIVGPDNNIRATGYNSFPRGIQDDVSERFERPEKYFWMEHAERNAFYAAARIGTPLMDSRMYMKGLPCMDCGRGMIQVGIREIIYNAPWQLEWEKTTPRYVPDFSRVRILLGEGGVTITPFSWPTS
jgi:dCMP deaminase